jgi:hypothetical protein
MGREPEFQTIEINGVKLEVDMRHAKRIESLRVGTRVKVLIKSYGDSFNIYPGIVVGFEPFPQLPSIIIAYVMSDFSKSDLKFLTINAGTKDAQVIAAVDDDLQLDRDTVLKQMDREIAVKEREIEAINDRKAYFTRHFASFWEHVDLAPAAASSEPF